MSTRCRHEIETKPDYPDDLICMKCQTIWHIPDYLEWTAKELMHHAPKAIRDAVLQAQFDKYAQDLEMEKCEDGRSY